MKVRGRGRKEREWYGTSDKVSAVCWEKMGDRFKKAEIRIEGMYDEDSETCPDTFTSNSY